MRMNRFSQIAYAFIVASGVATMAMAKPIAPISDRELSERLERLRHLPWAGHAVESPDGWLSGCRKSTVSLTVDDPSSLESRTYKLLLVRPDTIEPVPAAIVLPTMDGVTAVERAIVSRLCAMNVAAILADVNQNTVPETIPSWGFEDENNRRAILALRTIIDYIERTSYFHPRKIGMIGSSLGGVTTSYMAGVESRRLGAVVIIVGGGNLPYTLTVSDNEKLTKLRELRMQAEGFSHPSQYEDKLRATVFLDPMHFTRRAVREKLFMVLSKSDTKVPTVVQEDLFSAFKKPEHTVFTLGHVPTVIGMAYLYFGYISEFLAKRFDIPALRDERMNQPLLDGGALPMPLVQTQ